jgi:replicative DNA helicase
MALVPPPIRQLSCPKCGNKVEADKQCPFCAYADSIGIPEEAVAPEGESAGGYDLPILNGFINNKFMLQKALEQNFVPDMHELTHAQKLARLIVTVFEGESKTEAWDKFILRTKLKATGQFTAFLDQYYSKVLEVPTPSLEQLLGYLNLCKNSYAVRVLSRLGDEFGRFTRENRETTREVVDRFVAHSIDELHGIQKLSVNKRINLVKKEMEGILSDIEFREKNGEVDIIGYSIEPFKVMNSTLSGLRNGFLYCLAGAPRRGKTNLALDIATYCARENQIPVLFFTFEQTKKNLTYRLLSKESYMNPGTLQRKRILNDPLRKAKLADGIRKMSEYKDYLYIIESTKEDNIDRIRGHAYNVMQEHDTSKVVIFIDYIQKMPLSSNYDNEKFKVEEISTSLKGLSIELNCPIFAISSLNKEGCHIDETDGPDRPSFFHCKGSGDIEYDVDAAMVLGKDWGDSKELQTQLMHKAEQMGKDPTRLPLVDIVNVYIDKNRDAPEGMLGIIQYFFFIAENKYIELGYKLDTDVYRFKKIENLVAQLIQRDFIKFYDYEERARTTQFDEVAAQKAGPAAEDGTGEKKKIRLKY